MVPASSVKVPRVSTYSGSRHVNSPFAYGAFTLSGWLSQNHSAKLIRSITRSEPRNARIPVWALPFSLAATHRITCCFLFLRLLRCFSSPGSLPYVMDWRKDTGGLLQWVPPFRDLRIVGYLLLPEAFRSLSRLSSALSAKASTICSFYHDQNVSIALLTLASGSSLAGLVSFLLQKLYLGCLVFFFEILSCMRFSRYVRDVF